MKTQPALAFITGFAYALQHITRFVTFKTNGTNRAYLFSYESKLRDRYLGNLMSLVLDAARSPEYAFFGIAARQYIEKPIVEREEFFDLCSQYFSIERVILSEETFNYSILVEQGRSLGKEVYDDHFDFFQKLIRMVLLRQTSGNTDASCGIIFTSRE